MLRDCLEAGLTAREAGLVLGRKPAAVRRRADRLQLGFQSGVHAPLRQFLRRGGHLVREEIGGRVGVRWGRAHRSGPAFDTPVCEQLLILGLIVPAETTGVYRRAMEAS